MRLSLSFRLLLWLLDSLGPAHQILKELADQLFCLLIGQVSLRIEALGGVADHDLRLVERKHIEEEEHLARRVWRPRRAESADGSAHDRYRFAIPGAVSIGSRRP